MPPQSNAANLVLMQLPLWQYLLVSGAAIAVVAFLVWRLRPGVAPPLSGAGALDMFCDDFPGVGASGATMTPDGRNAIVTTPGGEIVGCVSLVGLRWTTRSIAPKDVLSVRADGERSIVSFNDFTWPQWIVDWGDAGLARQWAARIEASRGAFHA